MIFLKVKSARVNIRIEKLANSQSYPYGNQLVRLSYSPSDFNAEVSPDGAGFGVSWSGLSHHLPCRLDDVGALPAHGEYGAGRHVLAQAGVEGLVRKISVVLLQQILAGLWGRKGEYKLIL